MSIAIRRYIAKETMRYNSSNNTTQNSVVRNMKTATNNKKPIIIKLTKQDLQGNK